MIPPLNNRPKYKNRHGGNRDGGRENKQPRQGKGCILRMNNTQNTAGMQYPIFAGGRVVGEVKSAVFSKRIKGSKHLLLKPVYKPVCWQCGAKRKLIKYHAQGGEWHLCKRCAGNEQQPKRGK